MITFLGTINKETMELTGRIPGPDVTGGYRAFDEKKVEGFAAFERSLGRQISRVRTHDLFHIKPVDDNFVNLYYIENTPVIARWLITFAPHAALMRNFEPGGIGYHCDIISAKITLDRNQSNLVLVPVRKFKDPTGDYWEYKLHYTGDNINLTERIDGTIVGRGFSKFDVSIFGNIDSLCETDMARFKHDLGTEGSIVTGGLEAEENALNEQHKFVKRISFSLRDVSLNNEINSKPLHLKGSYFKEIKDLVDGKLYKTTIATYAQWHSCLREDEVLSDYVAFKRFLRLPENKVPNPDTNLDILNNKLVASTLARILHGLPLIIANRRFYRQLKHLGLIQNYSREMHTFENKFYIWKLLHLNNKLPETASNDYAVLGLFTFKAKPNNVMAKTYFLDGAANLTALYTESKDELQLEVIMSLDKFNTFKSICNNLDIQLTLT